MWSSPCRILISSLNHSPVLCDVSDNNDSQTRDAGFKEKEIHRLTASFSNNSVDKSEAIIIMKHFCKLQCYHSVSLDFWV